LSAMPTLIEILGMGARCDVCRAGSVRPVDHGPLLELARRSSLAAARWPKRVAELSRPRHVARNDSQGERRAPSPVD
jgi:hypothetical protein